MFNFFYQIRPYELTSFKPYHLTKDSVELKKNIDKTYILNFKNYFVRPKNIFDYAKQ